MRTGLSSDEFYTLVRLLERERSGDEIKRGRKLLELNVRLVIILQWIQSGQTFKVLGFTFGLTDSRVQTSITSLWNP